MVGRERSREVMEAKKHIMEGQKPPKSQLSEIYEGRGSRLRSWKIESGGGRSMEVGEGGEGL